MAPSPPGRKQAMRSGSKPAAVACCNCGGGTAKRRSIGTPASPATMRAFRGRVFSLSLRRDVRPRLNLAALRCARARAR